MAKFKEKLYRFMYGRYGNDNLNKFLFGTILVIFVADIILTVALSDGLAKTVVNISLSLLSAAAIVLYICRAYSRKIAERRRENQIFLRVCNTLARFFTGNTSYSTKSKNLDSEQYIFRDCTHCRTTLRLPRKEGRNRVKCPKCSHSFFVKASKLKTNKNTR